jgi:lipopolysaccharide biosynthesis glycosyltransferase
MEFTESEIRNKQKFNQAIETIVVTCVADDRYSMQLAVTIRSALENLRSNYRLDLFIIDGGIKEHNKKKILDTLSSMRCEVNFLSNPLTETIEEAYRYCEINSITVNKHVSLTSYYRLFIPELLPKHLEKVIYLDCDTVVIGDLAELWCIDLGKNHISAVQDIYAPYVSSHFGLSNYYELGIPHNYKYFNAGVLVINMNQWRLDQITSKALGYIKQNVEFLRFHDQDVLNALLVGQWKELDARWNYMVSALELYTSSKGKIFTEEFYLSLIQEPYIIHYASPCKPWNFRKTPYKEHFFKYVDLTEWSGWRLTLWKILLLNLMSKIRLISKILINNTV